MFKMKGVVPPMITPFDEQGNVDYKSLNALVDYLKDNVDGIFITGSYGCGALMSLEERKKVLETVLSRADGKIDVVVMTGTTNNRDTVELTKHAYASGADAVSAIAPFYFKHNSDNVCHFFEDMTKAVPKDYPISVYNNPSFQGYPLDFDTLKRLKNMGISGIKDATFDIMLHAKYQRLLKDESFDVALGTEAMWLPAWSLGCEAFIPGLGNAFPEICRQMYTEAMSGQIEKCRETQFKVNQMRDIMYYARSTVLAIYAMLEIRGIITAYPRAPFIPATPEEKNKIKEALTEII